ELGHLKAPQFDRVDSKNGMAATRPNECGTLSLKGRAPVERLGDRKNLVLRLDLNDSSLPERCRIHVSGSSHCCRVGLGCPLSISGSPTLDGNDGLDLAYPPGNLEKLGSEGFLQAFKVERDYLRICICA